MSLRIITHKEKNTHTHTRALKHSLPRVRHSGFSQRRRHALVEVSLCYLGGIYLYRAYTRALEYSLPHVSPERMLLLLLLWVLPLPLLLLLPQMLCI